MRIELGLRWRNSAVSRLRLLPPVWTGECVALALLWLGWSFPADAAALLLDAPVNHPTAQMPYHVIPIDLDDDGDLDVAAAEKDPMGAAIVELFENPGDGRLIARTQIVTADLNRLAVGDFNADNRLDLAQVHVVGLSGGELQVWLRNGAFSFERRSFALPFAAVSVIAGELDGRAGTDLVIPDDLVGRQIFTYLSDGHGAFTLGGSCETEVSVRDADGDGLPDSSQNFRVLDCALGDLNGDGRNDVLLSNSMLRRRGSDLETWVVNVVSLFNQGNGSLGPWQLVLDPDSLPVMGVANFEGSLALGDLDADGDLDFCGLEVSDVLVLRNRGDGSFEPAKHFSTGDDSHSARGVALVDVDGDLDVDVAARLGALPAGQLSDPPVERWVLLRNDGTGNLGPGAYYPGGAGLLDLAFGDLDQLAGPEALTVATHDLRLAVNDNRAGQFRAPRVISMHDPQSGAYGTLPCDFKRGDFNHDGRPDLAMTASTTQLPGEGPAVVGLLAGLATGLAGPPVFVDVAEGALRLWAGDIAGGRADDLVVAHVGHTLAGVPDGVSVILGTEGVLPAQSTFTTSPQGMPRDVAGLHWNGGPAVASLRLGAAGGTARITLSSVAGNGALSALREIVLGSDDFFDWDLRTPEVLGVTDLNGDGRDDLVAVTANQLSPSPRIVTVLLQQAGGSVGLVGDFRGSTGSVSDMLLADVNRDGRPDVLLTWLADAGDSDQEGGLDVLLQQNDATLSAPFHYTVGRAPSRLACGELDGRPGLDLAVACDLSNEITLLLNNGSGAFPTREHYLAFGGSDCVAVGDFDNDGWDDVAVLNHDDELGTAIRHNPMVSLLKGLRGVVPQPDLKIQAAWIASGQMVLRLIGLNGAGLVALERQTQLTPGTWQTVAQWKGGPASTNWSEPVQLQSAFYRLRRSSN